jgi:hypothetical protein
MGSACCDESPAGAKETEHIPRKRDYSSRPTARHIEEIRNKMNSRRRHDSALQPKHDFMLAIFCTAQTSTLSGGQNQMAKGHPERDLKHWCHASKDTGKSVYLSILGLWSTSRYWVGVKVSRVCNAAA